MPRYARVHVTGLRLAIVVQQLRVDVHESVRLKVFALCRSATLSVISVFRRLTSHVHVSHLYVPHDDAESSILGSGVAGVRGGVAARAGSGHALGMPGYTRAIREGKSFNSKIYCRSNMSNTVYLNCIQQLKSLFCDEQAQVPHSSNGYIEFRNMLCSTIDPKNIGRR